jgi:hypothetical protein
MQNFFTVANFIAEILKLVGRCVKKGSNVNVEQWFIVIFYKIGQKLQYYISAVFQPTDGSLLSK